jgi:hypothetical protein
MRQDRIVHGQQAQPKQEAALLGAQFIETASNFRHETSLPQPP